MLRDRELLGSELRDKIELYSELTGETDGMFLLQGLLISLVGLRWAKKGSEKEDIGKEMNLIQTVGSVLNAEAVNVIKKTIVLIAVHT